MLVAEPEPVWIDVCEHHGAVVDRNAVGEEPDFWRWASAMMQAPGAG
jgi:hypothetical protein